jgi:hypothetical protein
MMCWHISKAIAMVSFAISTSLQSGIYLIKRLQEAGYIWCSTKFSWLVFLQECGE